MSHFSLVNSMSGFDMITYSHLDSKSYQVKEKIGVDLTKNIQFKLKNPNIDTSFHNNNKNKITFIVANDLNKQASQLKDIDLNIQLINVSMPLFESLTLANKMYSVSNFVGFNLINMIDPLQKPKLNEIGYSQLVIKFSLNYAPASQENISKLQCVGFQLENTYFKQVYSVQGFSDEKLTASCVIDNLADIEKYFFAIVYSK